MAFFIVCFTACREKPVLQPVNHHVQAQPHHVHEVPVPSSSFKCKVAVWREVALDTANHDEEQHESANGHVEAVETGQHEEGGAENARSQFQVQIAVSVNVFISLEAHEDCAQQHG